MFELFLVMITLTSPVLIIILVRHYFRYKSAANQQLLALQKETNSHTARATQEKLAILVERVIVLEKIVTDSNTTLRQEIKKL
ncbi:MULTISPECIES: hypothetical protein [unclassified Colwellia]|jgi:hypothetical protein|uniref:hypothetical protein n=1 Tax=unclassified Colwellia TaxID=196834 RepID=UPI0015F6E57C|nr:MULTISPECIES: hypothetical protein [unclassified Colwellia]MBA6349661.1 hypothetical protein [Colwellia sp. BRX8-9]MBA6353164.1 hypothetical protein [Colwellia sp. BRX9-1]MBA6379713.1 hypothetical protein [Colwellia sp. BRX10-7]MBA6383854.1 hypothetical protein [Colwellia sp. BRX10-9]MBA6388099.1 hypothetical protein [Colwellia sp. BRX10-2]